jgi:hypothetical protein
LRHEGASAATRGGRIGVMTACVLCHNERFLLDAMRPVLKPYRAWYHRRRARSGTYAVRSDCLHAAASGNRAHMRRWRTDPCAVRRFQRLDERSIFPLSFTIKTVFHGSLLMLMSAVGFAFAPKRLIPQRRRWMTRSYAVSLTLVLLASFWADRLGARLHDLAN